MSTAEPADYDKPLPPITTLSRPYWDSLKNRAIALPHCDACDKIFYPPGPFCPDCWGDELTWTELSGRGTVNSWVVFHQAYFGGFAAEVPYNVAEITLEEGPRLLTNLVDVDNDAIEIGMAVEIVYDDATDEVTLAKFRPAR